MRWQAVNTRRLILTLFAALSCLIGETQVLSRIGAVSEPAPGVASVFSGNYVYGLSSGRLLLIIELVGTTPTRRSYLPLPGGRSGYGSAILKDADYVYVANDKLDPPSGSYLTIVNVSNPNSPSIVRDFALPDNVPTTLHMVKTGSYLYLFPESGEVTIVNVANPSNPVIVRRVTMTASGSVVVNNRLYTAERNSGIGVWDISQPDNPTRITTVNTGGNLCEVIAAGNHLYALSCSNPTALYILDISNPDAPNVIANFNTSHVADIAFYNNHLYLSDGLGKVQILDVSNPAAPAEVARLDLGRIHAIEANSARLLTAGKSFYRFYSLSNLANPTLIGVYTVPAPVAAAKSGNKVYTVEETGIGIYDVSSPSQPVLEQRLGLISDGGDIVQVDANTFAIAHKGNLSFVEFSGSSGNIVWSHTPTPPTSWFVDRVRQSGTVLAFLCQPGFGTIVRLIDVSNPDSPRQASDIPSVNRFDLRSGYLYITSYGPGNFKIYSVSDPDNPSLVGTLTIPFSAIDVAAGDNYALVTGINGEVGLVNISNPNAPQLVAQRTIAGVTVPRVLYSGDGYFFVYDPWNYKLEVYRVADFPNLTPYRVQALDASIQHFFFETNYVIGSADVEGLIVYQNLLSTGGMQITRITPNRAGNAGALPVVIEGAGFASGATVRLERGVQVIAPTSVNVRNANRIDAIFDFTGQPINTQWDVVVQGPDNTVVRLPNGFTIVEPVPTISAISPNSTLPLRAFTLTISGELFTPGAQVEIRPPSDSGASALRASSVQFINQRQLQATFDLQSFRSLDLTYGVSMQVVVINTNNRTSNAANLLVQGPSLNPQIPSTVYALRENQNLTLEITVDGAVANEPIEFSLGGWVQGQWRVLTPTQTEPLGNNRWRLTFDRASVLPDNFYHTWTPTVRQMGSTRSTSSISVHRYRAVRLVYDENRYSNLSRTINVPVIAFDADDSTTFVLRRGSEIRQPSTVNRYPTYQGALRLDATFSIQLTDVGQWDIEVRYGDETKLIANGLEIFKGTPQVSRVMADSYLAWHGEHEITFEGSGLVNALRVRAIINENANVFDSREIEAHRVEVNDAGTQLKARFRFADRLPHGTTLRYELYSPYTETRTVYDGRAFGRGGLDITYYGRPSFFRAGVYDTFVVAVQTKALPDAPTVVLPLPFTEQDMNSGQWDYEYQIREYSYYPSFQREIASGRRPLNLANSLLIAKLSTIPPYTTRYVEFKVRVIARGRAVPEPVLTRSRAIVAGMVIAAGLFIGGAILLDAACQLFFDWSATTAAAIADAASIDEDTAKRWVDWMLKDRNNIRKLRELYDFRNGNKSAFQHILENATNILLQEPGKTFQQAATEAASALLSQKFRNLSQAQISTYAQTFLDAWDAYQIIKNNQSDERAKQAFEFAMQKMDGLLLQFAFGENVFEPPEGINIPQPEVLGIILNVGVSTFMSTAADCVRRGRSVDELWQRLSVGSPAQVRTSWDPNEKRGSLGIEGYIANETITYELLFENLATATAGAQEVLVEDTLPEALDPDTIEFFEIQVGTQRIALPQGTRTLNTQIDLRPERPVVVRVTSNYDAATRKLSVRFSGIDPNTNDYHPDGFLPPNTNPPQGEGAVRFRIRPRSGIASGTLIENRAVITFDPHLQANPPIVTNTHRLTLDTQPPTITLETPSTTQIEGTRTTLRWNAADDASGVQEVEIWAQEGSNARLIGAAAGSGQRTESGTVIVHARRFGDETRITTRGRDRVGNLLPFSEQPELTLRFGQAPQFSAGLHLMTIPVALDNPDVQSLLGFQGNQWATYNPATGQYVQHPDPNASPQIGRGYWVLLPNGVQPPFVGELPSPDQPYRIPLQPGWNLIGNPWTEPVLWDRQNIWVSADGVLRPLEEATQWVEPYLWGWISDGNGGRYQLVYDAALLPGITNRMEPWRGYWLFAHRACELVIPVPEEQPSRLTRSPRPVRGGWSFRLAAHSGETREEILVGRSATDQGLQIAMPPAPPTRSTTSTVQLRLVRDGKPMQAELLPRSQRQLLWTVELHVPPAEDGRPRTVLITAPDITQLPRGVNPVLQDVASGERRYLRGSAGWQLTVPAEGLTRRFELSLVPTSRLLRIMNAQVRGGRGTNGQYTVQFTLSDAARITVNITAANRVVRTLEQSRSRTRGVQQLVWDGRDQQGRHLPPGNYLITIYAETEDGQIARASIPIILTR